MFIDVQQLTNLRSYDCNGTAAQKWVLNSGTTSIQLAGTNYCLDAGSCTSFLCPAFAPHVSRVRHLPSSRQRRPNEDLAVLCWHRRPDLDVHFRPPSPALDWQCVAPFRTLNNVTDMNTTDLCLDMTNGSTANGNVMQTWSCTSGNTNQVWTE